MHEAHYHLHVAPVYRSKLQSAIASAAYQANQCLTHESQRLCTVSIDHRKGLNKGSITDALRQELEAIALFRVDAEGLNLLKEGAAPIEDIKKIEKENRKLAIALRKKLPDELKQWKTLLDRFEKADEELSERLRLWESNEGFTLRDKDYQQSYHLRLENGQMTVSRYHGVTLSEDAAAQKDKRRYWTIFDGDKRYTVHQHEETTYDKTTKKQTIIGRHLDIYGDKTHDYRDKGDVVEAWVKDPEHAPESIKALGSQREAHQGEITEAERQAMWQTAEDNEKSRNGRPARKIEVALLRELTYEQNKQALNAFIETHFTSKGIISDIAVHRKIASDGKLNEHAHILFFTREALPGGTFANTKNSYWNSRDRVQEWREGWESALNKTLKEAGVAAFVNKDSYKKRGLDKEPGQHLGPEQWAMEERQIDTEKGNENRRKKHDHAVQEAVQHILLDQEMMAPVMAEDALLIGLAAQDMPPATSEQPMSAEATPDQHLIGLAAQDAPDGTHTHHMPQQHGHYAPASAASGQAGSRRAGSQQAGRQQAGAGQMQDQTDAARHRESVVAFARTMMNRTVRASLRFASRLHQSTQWLRNQFFENDNAKLQRDGRETMFRRIITEHEVMQQERNLDYER